MPQNSDDAAMSGGPPADASVEFAPIRRGRRSKKLFGYVGLLLLGGVFVSGFLVGSKIGEQQISKPNFVEWTVRNHLMLTSDGSSLGLAYVCHGRVLAWRSLNKADSLAIAPVEPKPASFVSAVLGTYQGYAVASTGAALTAVIKGRAILRAVARPGTTRSKRLIAFLASAASGAIIGYQWAIRARPSCDGADALALLKENGIWDQAERFMFFRLRAQKVFAGKPQMLGDPVPPLFDPTRPPGVIVGAEVSLAVAQPKNGPRHIDIAEVGSRLASGGVPQRKMLLALSALDK